MGFGGSASAANATLKNNRRERKSKISKFQNSTGSNIGGIGDSPKLSAEEIEKVRIKIATKNEKRQRKILIFTAAVMLALIFAFIYYMF